MSSETKNQSLNQLSSRGRKLILLEREIDSQLLQLEKLLKWSEKNDIDIAASASLITEAIESFRIQVQDESHLLAEQLEQKQGARKAKQAKPEIRKKKKRPQKPSIVTSSQPRKLSGSQYCDKCKKKHIENWLYKLTDGTTKTLCKYCRGRLLDQQHGRVDALDRAVPGSYGSGRKS